MTKPLGSRIIDIIQSVITSGPNTTNNVEDIEDTMIDLCIDCSDPCSVHQAYPHLKINRIFPLQGSVKSHYKHVLISTGKSDWKSHIEDEDESLAAQLQKAMKGSNNKEKKIKTKDKKNKDKDKSTESKKPKILITNSSRKNSDNDPLFSEGYDVLLFSDYILVRNVSPKYAAEFYNQFLRGKNNSSSSASPVKFTVEPITYKSVILICSHMHRDKRCGITAPILKDEFDKVLKNKGLDVESRADNNDGVAVYMSSHIGGHKFAGNVIVYREGQGIWYGRVISCHVESIVEKTVIEGKIIKDLYRGSIMNDFVQQNENEIIESTSSTL